MKIGFLPVALDFGMQLIQVISHAQQKNLKFYFVFSTEQKSLELIVIFQNAKRTFHLNGTVHPVQDSFFAHDVFVRLLSLRYEFFGHIEFFIDWQK